MAIVAAPVALLAASIVSEVRPAGAAEPSPATVSVDFGGEQGPLLRTEQFNNFHTTSVFPEQRGADVAYLNGLGMRSTINRVWLNSPNEAAVPPCAEDIDSPPAPDKPCTLNPPFAAYLEDSDNVADAILGNLRLNGSPSFMTAGSPEAAQPLIERILLAIKLAHPKLTFVEAWNEPDEPNTTIQPTQVYEYYVPVYRAVNNINNALSQTAPNYVPMKVGGPALYFFNQPWLETFLDAYSADPDPAKRLDFISYHAYLKIVNGTNQFYKTDPSGVAGQRAQLDSMLSARGLDTNIPTFVTETGMYPGPLCDRCDSTDFVRNAAGMASLQYWYSKERITYPFNWLTRQRAGGLKDEFVTRNATGPYLNFQTFQQIWPALNPIPANTFTPFGNMKRMKSMMKTTEVSASSNSLANGLGVYATASKDHTGASLMVWNYQGCSGTILGNCPTTAYSVEIEMTNLPANLRNRPVVQKMFRIDQNTSNYYSDPSAADLQEISSKIVTTGTSYSESVVLEANGIYLIVLEPTVPPSKDACKNGGWEKYVDDNWRDFPNQGLCVSWVNRQQ
jgi:hypothetical protein